MARWQEDYLWAIDVLTEFIDMSDDPDAEPINFALVRAQQYAKEPDGEIRLHRGLIGLASLLLARLTLAQGESDTPEAARAVLHEIALGLRRELGGP